METQNHDPPLPLHLRVLEYAVTKIMVALIASGVAIFALLLMASKVDAQVLHFNPNGSPSQVLVGYPDSHRNDVLRL